MMTWNRRTRITHGQVVSEYLVPKESEENMSPSRVFVTSQQRMPLGSGTRTVLAHCVCTAIEGGHRCDKGEGDGDT